ncbi:MAG TPA: ABC transporter ATP-binding protein/permease [Candidatus Binatia bacterium]
MKKNTTFVRDLWTLLRPYWKSEERGRAWLLLLANIALILVTVYLTVLFNQWYNAFYNTLQTKEQAEFFHQLGRFCVLAAIYIVVAVYRTYLNQMLQIRWRRWLTERYLTDWLSDRNYYRMQLSDHGTDNPDQRIAEDFRLFVDESLSLGLGFLNATVTLASFVAILWSLSGSLELPLGGTTYVLYGYMVWVAIVYAMAGTWLTHKIGKPLILLNFNEQKYEADFRFNLVRFRENCEGVALYHGEEDELRGFRARFNAVFENWWAIMKRQKLLTFFTAGYSQAAVIFPFVVGAPRFFSGAIQLGGLIQISNAFGQVQGALSWFIDAYTNFASWKASVDRLTSFHNAVMRAREESRAGAGPARMADEKNPDLVVRNLELELPTGRRLLSAMDLRITNGEHLLIKGPSGSGKSTLFRAIAGIWPFGAGQVRLPRDFRALFLPQRPYFPLGTLRQMVTYPGAPDRFTDAQVRAALEATGLGDLAERLDEQQNWAQQLSGGEQQRVAIARALLHKPSWLFLDEATSALDEPSQAQMYRLIRDSLKETTIISIAHRNALADFHGKVLDLEPRKNGKLALTALNPPPPAEDAPSSPLNRVCCESSPLSS